MNENPACGRAAGGKCEIDTSNAGYSNCVGSETGCPVNGLNPSGNSVGPYVTGVGYGCAVVGPANVDVALGDTCVAATVAGEGGSPGCSVEPELLHAEKKSASIKKRLIRRDISVRYSIRFFADRQFLNLTINPHLLLTCYLLSVNRV